MLRLQTPRLVLKPHQFANWIKVHQWQNDPELLWQSADAGSSQTEQESRDAVQRWITSTRPTLHLAVHTLADDELIGFCQIAQISPVHRNCRLGLVIGERAYQQRGYGSEAVEAMLDYCFGALQLHRVAAEAYSFNTRVIRLLERCGFTHEGTHREAIFREGFVDELAFGILAAEWRELRSR
jgi:RimJ/RimL family protein N-acetyltransferase